MSPQKENKASYRDVLRFAIHYWKPKKHLGLTAGALMALSVTMDSILPVFTGRIVDALAHAETDREAGFTLALHAFGGFVALNVLYHCFRVPAMFTWNSFAVDNLYRIVTDGMKKVQR